MKVYPFIIACTALLPGCSARQDRSDFTYIKVFTLNTTDSVTLYNKGLGISNYAYYQVNGDSLIYRNHTGIDPNVYETYTGHLNNKHYVDSIRTLLHLLRRFKNGVIETGDNGGVYCGPTFYVEYQDDRGEHSHMFALGVDTLNQFSDFFHKLPGLPWHKTLVINDMIKTDKEVVAAYRKLGYYDEIAAPYIPLVCGSGIDGGKIYGSWKVVNANNGYRKDTYRKGTFTRNGEYIGEQIYKDSSTYQFRGRFTFNATTNILAFKTAKRTSTYKVRTLTDNCLVYSKEKDSTYLVRMDRVY